MVAALLVEGGERLVEAAGVEMPLERLEAEICELAGHLAAGECRWLLLLSEFDRREGWTGWGLQSCAHWLSHRCGIGLQAAREKLRVGRRLQELPLVRGAFAAGELSYSKVRAVCRVARPETEATLLEMARYATTAQLEDIVRAYRSVTGREELRHANDRHDARFARWHWDDDGSLVLTARLSPEDGAAVLAAIDAGWAVAEPPAPGGSAGVGDLAGSLLAEARSADALVAMAKLALTAPAEGDPPAPEIVIVDRPTLRGPLTRAVAILTAESPSRRRRLGGWPVTAPSRHWSRRPTAHRSMWGASAALRRRRRAGRCAAATAAAASPAAASAASSMLTTSSTGSTVARRSSSTLSCSAAVITALSTKAATGSRLRAITSSCSWTRLGGCSRRRHRVSRPSARASPAVTSSLASRSRPTPAGPWAEASPMTSASP